MTQAKHKYFTMGAGTTYTHVGFWCPPSKNARNLFTDYSASIEYIKPEECQGVCDHCGTSIVNHHIIQDENGSKFVVGSECIKKLNDIELANIAQDIEKASLAETKAAERKLMDELERKNNNGYTNKEMRSLLKKENEKNWTEKRILAAKPIVDFISGIQLKADKNSVLSEYSDTRKLVSLLNNPKKDPNIHLKNGLIRVVEFKYGKSRFSRSDIPVESKLAEFETLYQNFENQVLELNKAKLEIDLLNNKKYK